MSRITEQIVEQCDAGLISIAEATCALRLVDSQARFNANYADHYASYWRYTRQGQRARLALASL